MIIPALNYARSVRETWSLCWDHGEARLHMSLRLRAGTTQRAGKWRQSTPQQKKGKRSFGDKAPNLTLDLFTFAHCAKLSISSSSEKQKKVMFCKFAFFYLARNRRRAAWVVHGMTMNPVEPNQTKRIITKICSADICFPFLSGPAAAE